ncbi:MAG: FecR family protein [Candidatus Omnitrophica bacterium]|nr:FecR family protein [Candidatus Omnitrophota bacterium]
MKRNVMLSCVLFVACLFCLDMADTALAAEEYPQEFLAPRHVKYEHAPWTYEFDLDAKFSENGVVSPTISNFQRKYDQAWASLSATAKITDIRKGPKTVIVDIAVEVSGYAKAFSAPLATAKDPSTWTWGKTSFAKHNYEEFIMFPLEKYPQLRQIENFTVGEPATASLGQAPMPDMHIDDADLEKSRTCITYIEGEIIIRKPNGRFVLAQVDMDLEIGDRIEAKANSRATIVLAGTAIIRIQPETEFAIPENKANTKEKVSFIEMMKGVLWARARKDRDSLKVAVPNAVCGVRGTEFEVSYLNNVACVKVIEGKVWLKEKSKPGEIIINAGENVCLPKEAAAQAQAAQITGIWSSNFGEITFTQSGNMVSATYTHDKGKIEGKLEGNILRGTWSEAPTYKPPKDAGDIEFVFSPDFKSFQGKWRSGSERQTWNGSWSGKRIK